MKTLFDAVVSFFNNEKEVKTTVFRRYYQITCLDCEKGYDLSLKACPFCASRQAVPYFNGLSKNYQESI